MSDTPNRSMPRLPSPGRTDRFWLTVIGIVSVVLVGAVAFLILGPRPAGVAGRIDVSGLPAVNATFNGLAGVCLCVAYALIRRRRIEAHRRAMLGAFACSSAFLVSYVLYHTFSPGPTRYAGPYRGLYLAILASHIVLAVVIVPLALITLRRGWAMDVKRHRRIARLTLPLWLYVSATGVAIYGMLYG